MEQLGRERDALRALLEIYGAGEATASSSSKNGASRPAARAHHAPPPSPSSNGSTQALLDIVRHNPGIKTTELISAALSKIKPSAADPRKNMGTILRYQVKHKKIHRRGEGHYLPEE